MIRFDHFGWRFPDAASCALQDICLHIQCGEFVAVAGASGSGKTTLALAMCGLLVGRHDGEATGRVRVNGQDVADLPLHQTAQTIGLVQQNPECHFATLTVRDEIAFGMENRCLPRDEIVRRSADAMELLSITHLRERELSSLSGGEKQRVAVASLIAGHPDALVLDEPTASLDPEASRHLFHSLADLCRRTGLTVVIVEHKLVQLLPLEPRLIVLEAGRVVERHDTAGPMSVFGPLSVGSRRPPVMDSSEDPIAEVRDLSVALDGHTVLQDVSVEIRAGEVVALLGPNGGGKSTLLAALMGLVRPLRGAIRVCGETVSPAAVSELARHVGLVFQNADHQLVTDSVWREAIYAARNFKRLDAAVGDRARSLLAQAGLSDRTGDHPFRLSWGQKRRLNVISAILHRPSLLLLDEPFAGQDWENAQFLLEVLEGIVRGSSQQRADPRGACLLVTHDPRIVLQSCTRVIFLSGGRVALDAPVPKAFDRLLEMGHDAYVPPQSTLNRGRQSQESGT